jgi:phosphohistidine swiveling domain-containing protein
MRGFNMADRWLVETDLSEKWDFYTRANVGEVFPDPVAPLSFSYMQTGNVLGPSERGFQRAYIRFGSHAPEEFPEDQCTFLGVTGGYCYLNASAMRLLGHRAPGMTAADIDYAFFGDAPGVPPFEPGEGDDRPDLTAKIGETFQWIFTTTDLPDVRAHEELGNRMREERPDLGTMSEREIADRGFHLFDTYFEDLFAEHIFISACATVPIGTISGVCEAVGRPEDTLKLIAGLGDVESAAPSMAMWKLGRVASKSDALNAIFDAGIADLEDRLRADSDDPEVATFLGMFDTFLVDFGSRGPNEWEQRCPTWETDPNLALAAIDRMRLSDASRSPFNHNAERAEERERLGAEIAELLADDPQAQGEFVAALHAATVFMPGRERTKTNCVKLIQEGRMGSHEIGRRRVAAAHFHHHTDFALLTREEFEHEVDNPGTFTAELREREALFHEVAGLQEPFLFIGGRPDMSTYRLRSADDVEPLDAGDVLVGVGGCPGVARGIARVVLDSHDPTALAPGDILVAPITDPSWTPLFVPAEGVVVDVGAPLSHAIIVSRELGIPCVVSATDATKKIRDGALIEVDGTTGVVTVLETP